MYFSSQRKAYSAVESLLKSEAALLSSLKIAIQVYVNSHIRTYVPMHSFRAFCSCDAHGYGSTNYASIVFGIIGILIVLLGSIA